MTLGVASLGRWMSPIVEGTTHWGGRLSRVISAPRSSMLKLRSLPVVRILWIQSRVCSMEVSGEMGVQRTVSGSERIRNMSATSARVMGRMRRRGVWMVIWLAIFGGDIVGKKGAGTAIWSRGNAEVHSDGQVLSTRATCI